MKNIRRFLFSFFAMSVMWGLHPRVIYANETQLVVVYDISGSMQSADPYGQAEDTIAMFLDKIPAEQYPVKIAIIPFSTDAEVLKKNLSDGWWYIADENDEAREELKNKIYELSYNGKDTDIEMALTRCSKAMEQMKASASDGNQIVLFITDGYTDISSDMGKNNKFEKIVESYNRLIKAGETFPADCCFLAIIPDVKNTNMKDIIKDGNKVTYYFNKAVPEKYQEKMLEVIDGAERFFELLTQRQSKKMMYKSRLEMIDWQIKGVIDQVNNIFGEFFDEVFNTYTVSKKNVSLRDGYEFEIPQMIEEVGITIVPESSSVKERRDNVKLLEDDGIYVIHKGKEQNYNMSSSRSAITLKITSPSSGLYKIKTDKIPFTCSLKFSSYGALKIEAEDIPQTGILGEKITLKGRIVDGDGNLISTNEGKNIRLWLKNQESNEKVQINLTEGVEFEYDYVLTNVGEHYIAYEITYDDTNLDGVFAFVETVDLPHIVVPKVQYKCESINEDFYAGDEVGFKVIPYSIIDDDEIEVSAEACSAYLMDQWEVYTSENEEKMSEIASDKKGFTVTYSFPDEGNYVLNWKNKNTGQILQQDVEIKSRQIQLTDFFEEIIKVPCSLTGVCQSEFIDTSAWILAFDGKPYTIDISEGELFKAVPAELHSGENKLVQFRRKDRSSIHWFQSERLEVSVKDQYGKVCLNTDIMIREQPTSYVKAVLGCVAACFIVLLIVWVVRRSSSVAIRVMFSGKSAKVIKVRMKEGATKKCKINGEDLTVFYSAGRFRYRYKGQVRLVDENTISIR